MKTNIFVKSREEVRPFTLLRVTLAGMKRVLCIGLGNPGDQYTNTRHNAGWLVLDAFAELWSDPSILTQWKKEKNIEAEVLRMQKNGAEWILIKPQTFMNESGRTVSAACKWYLDQDPSTLPPDSPFPQIVILHDDLDIVSGSHKLQFASGPKVHNGVNSVRSALHSPKFWTARLGVDSRSGDRSIPGQAYVLQNMTQEERSALKETAKVLAEEFAYTVLQ